MHNQPLTITSWKNAILHVDGDSFFASVEQALKPEYKNKPLITGHERGIASAMSKEAKLLGITRGMPVALIKRNYPECIIVPGNYEAYTMFACRMFAILRTFTPIVEEYSIDEAFADIAGMRRYFNCGYEDIARKVQTAIEQELDITVSVGVSLTKSLAKLCSKFRKPHGITCVEGKYIHILLQKTAIGKVWGIGHQTESLLTKYGCKTAYDFVMKPIEFIEKYLTKRELEIYKELRGELVYPLVTTNKSSYKSISKGRTFEPTTDKNIVFAQLVKNIEDATAKCRKYELAAKKITVVLKTQQFISVGKKATVTRVTNSAMEIVEIAKVLFDSCFIAGNIYRSTVFVLSDLTPLTNTQLTIFDNIQSIEKMEEISATVDKINKNFGYGTMHLGASLPVRHRTEKLFKISMMKISV